MKTIKIFLAVVIVLLVIAILLGVYVWYSVQKLNTETQGFKDAQEELLDSSNQQGAKIEDITIVPDSEMPANEEVIEIHTADLTESQQKTLQAFGLDGDSFMITEGMISCAKDAVGAERYEAILNGAAPSPLESTKMFPCMNK